MYSVCDRQNCYKRALNCSCRVVSVAQLHRSEHGKKWFDCTPCPATRDVRKHFETLTSAARPTPDKFVAVANLQKNNDIKGTKDSIHRKKSIGGLKSRQKSAVAGHKVKKIGT